jgi:hypothetical protein
MVPNSFFFLLFSVISLPFSKKQADNILDDHLAKLATISV